MIMGIGVDMVSEARVARSIKRPGFLEKVYGPAERALLEGRGMRPQTAAAILPQRKPSARHLAQGFCGSSHCARPRRCGMKTARRIFPFQAGRRR